MEFDINDDPMTYEARPIFGYWTRRQAAVGGCVIVMIAALSALSLKLEVDPVATGSIAACIGAPVGYFFLSRRHGLLPEEWIPIVRRERSAPAERVWTPPRAHVEQAPQGVRRPTREELREARAARRARAAETEEDSLLGAYLSIDDEIDAMSRKEEAWT